MKKTEFTIEPYLRSIEYEYGIKIIGAWDRGSRAWNSHSEESDYDIRICFTQPYTNYIMGSEYIESIKGSGETLDTITDTDIDPNLIEYQGWDIKKFITLLNDNNPSAFECLASSIEYQTHPIFQDISDYALERIHPIELWNHYYRTTKRHYHDYIENQKDLSAKRLTFIFRSILCGEYIRHTHEFPPIGHDELLKQSPESCFEYISKKQYEQIIDMKRDTQTHQIGDKYQNQIESYLELELNYQDHIPDETIQQNELDSYVEKLIQSTTMFL